MRVSQRNGNKCCCDCLVPPSHDARHRPRDRARPASWNLIHGPSRLRLVAPEGDFSIDTVDVAGVADARAAAAAAARTTDPAFARPVLLASQNAAGES